MWVLRAAVLPCFEVGVQLLSVLNIERAEWGVLYLKDVSRCLLL